MLKKMLINASNPEECRVAVVSDGVLEELDVQVKTYEATLGNIYKAVISRVEPSLQAVFVDYGGQRNGFLPINDIHPSYFPESFATGRRRPKIQDVFKKDDHVIVQVNKEERHTKGASLTTNISLAGRYLVLMPGTDLCGVSRKIEDEKERKKLKDLLKQLTPPENMGFIIRTAGMGRTKTELSRDLDYLLKLWQSIEKQVADEPAPAILHREHDIVIRSIREHFSPDISEILVDEKEVHKKARDFFHQVMPKYENLVKLSQEKRPLFNKYQLEEQIEQVYRRRIKLKSGGYILIEPTEAMVTVDVNSGGATKERGLEDTAFLVNMEAAPEIARQLRLRDLGGIIVIDFIDMAQKMHNQEVEKALRTVLKQDRAKTKVLRMSALGVLELSRQRLKSSLGTGEYWECPLCDGRGRIRSAETSALAVFRRVKSLLVKGDVTEVRVTVPAKVAEYLLNNMRSQLVELEGQYSTRISVLVRQALPDKEITVEAVKEEPEHPAAEWMSGEVPAPPQVLREDVAPISPPIEDVAPAPAAKKPGKSSRRRWSRRKSSQRPADTGNDNQVGGSEAEGEKSDMDRGLESQEPGLAETSAHGAEPSHEPVGHVAAGVGDTTAMDGDGQQGPEFQADVRQSESDAETAPRDSRERDESELPNEPEKSTDEQIGKKENGRRRALLQDYLPFS